MVSRTYNEKKQFFTRREGIMKKAHELHKLCGVKITILIDDDDDWYDFRSEPNWPAGTAVKATVTRTPADFTTVRQAAEADPSETFPSQRSPSRSLSAEFTDPQHQDRPHAYSDEAWNETNDEDLGRPMNNDMNNERWEEAVHIDVSSNSLNSLPSYVGSEAQVSLPIPELVNVSSQGYLPLLRRTPLSNGNMVRKNRPNSNRLGSHQGRQPVMGFLN